MISRHLERTRVNEIRVSGMMPVLTRVTDEKELDEATTRVSWRQRRVARPHARSRQRGKRAFLCCL